MASANGKTPLFLVTFGNKIQIPKSPHRTEMSAAFLEKLYNLGLIPTKWNLENCDKVGSNDFSSFLKTLSSGERQQFLPEEVTGGVGPV